MKAHISFIDIQFVHDFGNKNFLVYPHHMVGFIMCFLFPLLLVNKLMCKCGYLQEKGKKKKEEEKEVWKWLVFYVKFCIKCKLNFLDFLIETTVSDTLFYQKVAHNSQGPISVWLPKSCHMLSWVNFLLTVCKGTIPLNSCFHPCKFGFHMLHPITGNDLQYE